MESRRFAPTAVGSVPTSGVVGLAALAGGVRSGNLDAGVIAPYEGGGVPVPRNRKKSDNAEGGLKTR